MSTYIGIEFQGNQLNYAEVSLSQRALLQLGTCQFVFDVEQAFFNEESPQLFIDEINQALVDIFKFSEATEVRFSLHPRFTTLFYTPVGTDMSIQDRAKQFLQEARLLSGKQTKPLHIVPVPLFIEDVNPNDGVIWYQIMAIEKHIFNQAARILKGLNVSSYKFQSVSTDVAKLVAVSILEEPLPHAPFILTIGCFNSHIELMVCRKENLHFTTFSIAEEPLLIQIQNILKQMNLDNATLHRVYFYGNAIKPEYQQVVKQFIQVPIEILNVVYPLFSIEVENATHYTVCLGAAL